MADVRANSLAAILFGPEGHPDQAMLDRIQAASRTQENRESIAAQMPHVEWPVVWRKIEHDLPGLFDIDLEDIVAGAFRKYRELEKYCDTERYPPTRSVTVPLGERRLSSRHKPRLEINVDGVHMGDIEFVIELKMQLKAAALELRGGVIEAIDTGHASLQANVWLGKVPLLEKRLADFDLPGHLDIAQGIPLPWATPGGAADISPSQEDTTTPADRTVDAGPKRRSYLSALSLVIGLALLALVAYRQLTPDSPPPSPVAPVDPPLPALTIDAVPADATIRFNDGDKTYVRGMQLEPGVYEILVSHPDYRPWRGSLTLRDEDLYRQIELARRSPPATAPGKDPVSASDRPPRPTPSTAPSERSAGTTATPAPPVAEDVTRAPDTVEIALTSDPPDAYIEVIGVGEYRPGMRLEPGTYQIRLRRDGYQTTYGAIRVRDRRVTKRFVMQESLF